MCYLMLSDMQGKKSQGQQVTTVLPKCSPEIRRNVVRNLIQLAVNSVEGKHIGEGALEKVQTQVGSFDEIHELYAVILNVIRSFLRLPHGQVKPENLKVDLKELKFSDDSITDFLSVLYGPKREILDNCLSKSNFYLKLERFRWRLDITISSSVLSRVLEPSLRFEMVLSDGQCVVFEVSISKFHELRYNVAAVLKEMEILEKRKFLKGTG